MNPTDTNSQTQQNRPIYIDPKAGKPRLPKPLLWVLGCLGGCFALSILSLIFLSAIIGLVAAGTSVNFTESIIKDSTSPNKVAVIPINGVITDDLNDGSNLLNLQSSTTTNGKVESMLDFATNDKDVQAIILRENTPGGSTLAMRKICKKIEAISIPVYTYIESEGASAGYYIANCTKFIIADSTSITGSIGALVEATDVQGLLDKIGIKTKVITNSQGTSKQSDLFQSNSKDEAKIKTILDDVFEDFVKQVVKGRNTPAGVSKISEEKIRTLATGEIFSGKQAKENGLIDETGMFDDAVKMIKSREALPSELKVVQYGYTGGWFASSLSSLQGIIGIKNSVLPIASSTIYSIRQ